MSAPDDEEPAAPPPLGPPEVGALAHLYRAEVYRGTVWRARLDTTTNWSIVTLGLALSLSFASPESSALPLLLTGVLILVFLWIEARRFRYFNVWRERSRLIETRFLAPMLDGAGGGPAWRAELAGDYARPRYPISRLAAVAQRIRSNYAWILLVQTLAYLGKLVEHPRPAASWGEMVDRAAIGPVPGAVVLGFGGLYVALWAGLALWALLGRHAPDADDDAPAG